MTFIKTCRKFSGYGYFCFFIVHFSSGIAQSQLKTEFNLYSGGEYNIFKSPDVLYNITTGEYWNKDSLVISDVLFDVGYDIDFTKKKSQKYTFTTGSNLWYRHYLNYEELSQIRLNAYGDYTRFLNEKLQLGIFYNFRWSDRVGTSVTGDLLMRSFKYLGNQALIHLDMKLSEIVFMQLFSQYQYKIYYNENTFDPLDHGNLEVNYSIILEPGKKHGVKLELSFLDRQYSQYHALNANGRYSRSHPLRNFRYYKAVFGYNYKPIRGMRINPKIEVRQRVDMFEGYYSYLSYGGGLRIRYMWDDFYLSLYGDYSRLKYDIRKAFTSQADDPLLVYGYFDYQLRMKYYISKNWELELSLNSDNRSANSDLDYFKTRRAYNNYAAIIGIIYSLPDMKWK